MNSSVWKEKCVYDPVSDPAGRLTSSSEKLEPGKLYRVAFAATKLSNDTTTYVATIFDGNDKRIGQVTYRDHDVMMKDFPFDWMYVKQTHPHTMVTFTFDGEREPETMSILDEDLPKLREGFRSLCKIAAFRALGCYKPIIEHHLMDLNDVIDIKYDEHCLKEA